MEQMEQTEQMGEQTERKEKIWSVGGKTHSEVIYKENGKTICEYKENGKMKEKTTIEGKIAHVIIYYESGEKHEETWYEEGKMHKKEGPAYIAYYENGRTLDETWYEEGKIGKGVTYAKDGTIYGESEGKPKITAG